MGFASFDGKRAKENFILPYFELGWRWSARRWGRCFEVIRTRISRVKPGGVWVGEIRQKV